MYKAEQEFCEEQVDIFIFIYELVDILKVVSDTESMCQYTLLKRPDFREHIDYLIEIIEFFREGFYKFPDYYCKDCKYWKETEDAS